MDMIVNDLAAQYAILTEDVAGDAMVAGGDRRPDVAGITDDREHRHRPVGGGGHGLRRRQRAGPHLRRRVAGCRRQARPRVRPGQPDRTSQSTGLVAANFGSGLIGSIAGIPLVMSPPLATGTLMVSSTAATEAYEQRVGTLSVIEPSVLGVQVVLLGLLRRQGHLGRRCRQDHRDAVTPKQGCRNASGPGTTATRTGKSPTRRSSTRGLSASSTSTRATRTARKARRRQSLQVGQGVDGCERRRRPTGHVGVVGRRRHNRRRPGHPAPVRRRRRRPHPRPGARSPAN